MNCRLVADSVLALVIAAMLGPVGWSTSFAGDDQRIFRIGTGGEGGTYYPIGNLIGEVVTAGAAAPDCDCAVPGLLAVAQTSSGSVANVEGLGEGSLEAALVQADVAYWSYNGDGVFAGVEPNRRLRAIANLYPESVHVVSLRDSGLETLTDLRGRRVSLDERGSGTLVDARLVLAAQGLSERDMNAVYVKPDLAIERLAAGELDAFFVVAGFPVDSILRLSRSVPISLIPVEAAAVASMAKLYPFFAPAVIPAGTYDGVGAIPTVNVGAQLIVRADLSEALIYQVTRALWQEKTLAALTQSHSKGAMIQPDTALTGLAVPLHPGAERYYREVGLLK